MVRSSRARQHARPRRDRRSARALHPAVPARRRCRHLAVDDAAVPGEARPAVDGAAAPAGSWWSTTRARSCWSRRSMRSASAWARTSSGVPLAIPVAVLVFLGAFVPIVGAVFTGTLAVFLALVYNGPWTALWMLVVVLGVQQIEGHVLQPLLMGSAVKVHPLAVVLVVAGGAMIAGIPGALFAVPLAAFVNVVAVYIGDRGLGGAAESIVRRPHLDYCARARGGSYVSFPTLARVRGRRRLPRWCHHPHSGRRVAASVRAARRARVPEAGEPAAHRLVQDPRRDLPAVPPHGRGARARSRGRFGRKPRAGRRPGGAGPGHLGDDLHAARGAGAQAPRHPRLRRRRRARGCDGRDAPAARRGVRRAHRRGAHPPVRPSRHHHRPGHARPRALRRGARHGHRSCSASAEAD